MTASSVSPLLKNILIKISGEYLAGDKGFGISASIIQGLANNITEIYSRGVQISIVIGGGNFFRGVEIASRGMDRVTADYIGMMSTVMNSLALQSALEKNNIESRVMSALTIKKVAEPYIRRRATRHLEKKRIVILAGGTGNPYFTTDTSAVLRAVEVGAKILLKGTKVDGVYSEDPCLNKEAIKYDNLTYKEAINKELKVMDLTAITLCKENDLPIIVFDITKKDSLKNIFDFKKEGSVISKGDIKWKK
ncbi:MAG: UMP kinase [Candidatus Marinimicrobia bacterium]|nr:UMP kinase [Candidatus Neomarinimicrobiota bacterium]|tara:strand:- start:4023 stop:4772 length:750 start_codon:yes stop_codon:yes gene_type:complete